MRRFLLWASLCNLVLVTPSVAQVVANSDYNAVSTKLLVGAPSTSLSDFDQVLKIVGLPSVSGASSSAIGIDSNGNLRKDSSTTISTSGHWAFTNPLDGFLAVAPSTNKGTALGVHNIRVHFNTSPRLTFEYTGAQQWTIDNNAGLMRWFSDGATGALALQQGDNLFLSPYGKYVLPTTPYGFSIGSIQYPIDSLWAGNLFVQTLVALDEIGTVGSDWLIGNTNTLDDPLTTSGTTAIFRYNNFTNGDFAIFKTLGRKELIKITSSATAVNVISNGGFEAGISNWDISSGDTGSSSSAKSFRGDKSFLLTHGGSTALQTAYNAFASASSTAYTFCGYFRRDDAGTPVVGDVTAASRGGTAVNLTVEPTLYDGWFRMCGTFTSGTSGDTRAPFLDFSVASGASVHDWYMDAFQLEAGSTVRPYSEFRSSYTITRNQDGSGANDWAPGDAAFDTGGTVGQGWLQCYAISGLKSTSEVGPSCVANVRTGTTATAWAPRAAWGQLNGLYGYGSSIFGFAAGDGANTWAAMDDTNGFRIMSGATQKFRAYADGHLSIVEGAVTIDDLGIRITNSTSSSDEAKAYTFTGAVSHTKRTGLYYFESGGLGGMALYQDHGAITIQSTDHNIELTAASNASDIVLGSDLTLTTAGTAAFNSSTGAYTFASLPTTTSNLQPIVNSSGALKVKTNGLNGAFACTAGQHVDHITTENGIVTAWTCS